MSVAVALATMAVVFSCGDSGSSGVARCDVHAIGDTRTESIFYVDDNISVEMQIATDKSAVTAARVRATIDGSTYYDAKVHDNEADVDFGSMFRVHHAHLVMKKTGSDSVASGDIDGKALESIAASNPPKVLRYADGTTVDAGADPTIDAKIRRAMQNAVDQRGTACQSTGAPSTQAVPGQVEATTGDPSCLQCQLLKCPAEFLACVGTFAASCSPFLAVPFIGGLLYGLCVFGGTTLVCAPALAICIVQCLSGSECCPKHCGRAGCCREADECLNPLAGTCLAGTQPCDGIQCCETIAKGEACIGDGSGTCCTANQRCGNVCCPEGQACQNNACVQCPPQQHCGANCCNPGECLPPLKFCCPVAQQCGGNPNLGIPNNICCSSPDCMMQEQSDLTVCCDDPMRRCGSLCCLPGRHCVPGNPPFCAN